MPPRCCWQLCLCEPRPVGPPFARYIAKLTIWLPFSLGVAFLCTCFVVLAAMPDSTSYAQDAAPVPDSDGEPALKVSSVLYTRLAEILVQFRSRNMYLALPMFYAGTFRNVSVRALLQYVHVRLGWDLPDVRALLPPETDFGTSVPRQTSSSPEVALVNLLLFFFLVPRP